MIHKFATSLYQEYSFSPNRGQAEVIGEKDGKGYQPERILIAAGQDPSAFDPLARMMVTAAGFNCFTNRCPVRSPTRSC